MRVLLLSAYAAHSHRHWQKSLCQGLQDWEWTVLELPPRHFSWRMRGNPLYWALEKRAILESRYDLLLATSMVDLATLRGLVPALARVPSTLYFHENQFAYPHRQRHSPVEAQMVSLYSALAADRLLFNSRYNRDTFVAGCDRLLRRLPDYVPRGVPGVLEARAEILPVPCDLAAIAAVEGQWPGRSGGAPGKRPLRLLWSGRFEYDKGGERLLALLAELERSGLEYELALTGPSFRRAPEAFALLRQHYRHRLVHCGFMAERSSYYALLRAADLVLSTALHEFQGLAVLEAVAAGCVPVLPGRLAYPEIYPAQFCYPADEQDMAREARAAAALVLELGAGLRSGQVIAPDVSGYGSARLLPRYRGVLTALAASRDGLEIG